MTKWCGEWCELCAVALDGCDEWSSDGECFPSAVIIIIIIDVFKPILFHSLVTGAYCLGIFQIGNDPTTTLGGSGDVASGSVDVEGRKKGLEMLPELDNLVADDVIRIFEKDEDDEEIELSGEWVEYIDENEEFDNVSDQY
ncbi:hypothetical protein L2E82_16096 [Cichorium intybus]|uniref:Uncharacterized protein n=1 Tax=Cichorium intybus TaxID=13427 RepID=A0ACB9F570_CICIN|nr:hypothetical protein L2E82_16096 [Cichorium intybus]